MAKATGKRKLGDNPAFVRVLGSMPRLKVRETQQFRTKVFQSGNSIAVRIPAGTRLEVGMEMDLTIEDGQFLSYDPVDAPKRKFDIAKVAGSAKGLKYVANEDRSFEPRPSSAVATNRFK
jgi:antitoxin VapB